MAEAGHTGCDRPARSARWKRRMGSRWKQVAERFPAVATGYRWVRRFGPHERAVRRLRRSDHGLLLQTSAHTKPNRYPFIFAFIAQRLSGVATPRVLSYGCSMGDEVFSLLSYLPRAEVVGIDINPRNIAVARRRARGAPEPPSASPARPRRRTSRTGSTTLCSAWRSPAAATCRASRPNGVRARSTTDGWTR